MTYFLLIFLFISLVWIIKSFFLIRDRKIIAWIKARELNHSQTFHFNYREKNLIDYIERILKQQKDADKNYIDYLQNLLKAMEVSPNGIILLDIDRRLKWCNEKASELFKLDKHNDHLQYLTNIVREPKLTKYLNQFAFSEPLKLKINQKTIVQITMYPYEDSFLLLIQDVTNIESAQKLRKDFIADISHELKTPLTVLTGFVDLLLEETLSKDETKEYLTNIQEQSHRMNSLISNLLLLAELEEAGKPLIETDISVNLLLNSVLKTLVNISQNSHIIEIENQSDALLKGSETEIMSAVLNLGLNAIRYTKKGSKITLKFDYVNQKGVISVIDNGEGISEEHLEYLTQRFYRTDRSRSRNTGGSGLGLSIVKHVMLRHDGRLEFMSKKEEGSVFKLVFPSKRLILMTEK